MRAGVDRLGSRNCLLAAAALMPIASAPALSFLSPIVGMVCVIVFLSERVGMWRWSAVGIALIGSLVLKSPGSDTRQQRSSWASKRWLSRYSGPGATQQERSAASTATDNVSEVPASKFHSTYPTVSVMYFKSDRSDQPNWTHTEINRCRCRFDSPHQPRGSVRRASTDNIRDTPHAGPDLQSHRLPGRTGQTGRLLRNGTGIIQFECLRVLPGRNSGAHRSSQLRPRPT